MSAPPTVSTPFITGETGQGSVSDAMGKHAVPPVRKQSLQLDCGVFVDGGPTRLGRFLG